ncbi:MAG: DNA mismatch repair endonuclease MutL [Candidatus Zixiibacteriota bacterium]|nr:MAG: DNA mismatch repair endonuclease MutL [candidate division Zixibacteria bacterium]
MEHLSRNYIRPLPERVINKIAAGEVIERPAAVVKELVENSIDAGASQIDIIIEKSGTRLIKIVDNGCGISEDQVEIAFSRHATSKIASFDDLNNLYSYGFRGEALPSIASISRLRMVTRTAESRSGTEIIYEGGVLQSKQPIAAPPGTTIEVENLFYNTPARRKFLKAESTEARHISRTATALAIGRNDIGFSYTINGRSSFSVPAESGPGERVASLLGLDKKLVAVQGETGPVKVTGFVGAPDTVQNNRYGQFVFVNSRYIYSPVLSHALVAGYGELIPRGTFPVGALLLTVDPNEVDVNVHPTKAEVRLSREREIHDAVYHIVKESLQQDGIIPVFKTASSGSPTRPAGRAPSAGAQASASPAYIPGIHQSAPADPNLLADLHKQLRPGSADTGPGIVRVDKRTGEVIGADEHAVPADVPESELPKFQLIGRFSNLYLIVHTGDDLYIVDQHTAHERVLYEETLSRIERSSVDAQTLLFPAQVELNPEQMAVFEEVTGLMNSSGFVVSHFGGRTVNIEAVPSVLSSKPAETAFLKVLDDLCSEKSAGHDLRKAMAQSIACRSAVMAGDRLTDEEATHLVDRLLLCENSYSCPHGRPTFVKISREDLDRQFGRT